MRRVSFLAGREGYFQTQRADSAVQPIATQRAHLSHAHRQRQPVGDTVVNLSAQAAQNATGHVDTATPLRPRHALPKTRPSAG